METNELKRIWQTLSDEKLIDKRIAKENIQRIIQLKSSKTIEALTKKMKVDYRFNIAALIVILALTVFATLFLNQKHQSLPVQGYLFLVMASGFYLFKAISNHSKIKMLAATSTLNSVHDSLVNVKVQFETVSRKESIIMYVSVIVLTVFANFLINSHTDFSTFSINSLQGYVLIFSVCYLFTLPWTSRYYFNKRYSGYLKEINASIDELNSME